jgi:two-component system, NarL family, nitrate/nitrite response regulator NarL
MTRATVHVVLVEDHTLLAQSLVVTLAAERCLVTTVRPPRGSRAPDLLDSITSVSPDVVMLDLDLGSAGDGAALIAPLGEAGLPVVVVTGVTDRRRWGECLASGARTVLPKSAPLEVIGTTLRAASQGGQVLAERHREALVREWQHSRRDTDHARARFDRLSTRERDVLAGLLAGRRVRDLAAEATVSESTVRSQVKSLLAKLGVTSQIAATAMARQCGWRPDRRSS